jgi:hypothetical protein
MRVQSFFFVGAAAAGFAGCRSQAIDDRANERLSEVRASAERSAVYPTCPDRETVAGNCGLLLKRASTEDFRARFRDKKCADKTEAACEALYQRMLDAWLVQRYRYADWREVGLVCDGNPGRCDDPVAYELLLLDSHNLRVRDDFARTENQIEAQRAAAQRRLAAQQVQVASAVLGEVAYGAHKGPKCRSYPSAFSGVTNTVCAP